MTLPPGVPLRRTLPSLTGLHPRGLSASALPFPDSVPCEAGAPPKQGPAEPPLSPAPCAGSRGGGGGGAGPQGGGREGERGPSQALEGPEAVNGPSCGLFC